MKININLRKIHFPYPLVRNPYPLHKDSTNERGFIPGPAMKLVTQRGYLIKLPKVSCFCFFSIKESNGISLLRNNNKNLESNSERKGNNSKGQEM